jgi:hypothetical protein
MESLRILECSSGAVRNGYGFFVQEHRMRVASGSVNLCDRFLPAGITGRDWRGTWRMRQVRCPFLPQGARHLTPAR